MPLDETDLTTYVSRVRMVGDLGEDAVKTLSGFRKGRHRVPDSLSPATQAFFGRLCEDRIAEEGEDWFQKARAELNYKRKDLTLEVTSPHAVLTAKDFIFEIAYSLSPDDPARFEGKQTLHDVQAGCLGRDTFERLFEGQFSEIVFDLTKGVAVEGVIDAVEDLDGATGLQVAYPSDYSSCVLTVTNIEAEVECDGSTLSMRFPRAGGPSELIEAFGAVRHAFRLSKKTALAGLLE
jgi:hypothetical protein